MQFDYTVTVTLRDVNDNAPVFQDIPYSTNVNEVGFYQILNLLLIVLYFTIFPSQLTPVGTTIFRQLTAVDKDSGRNGDIVYTVVPGDGSIVRLENDVKNAFS